MAQAVRDAEGSGAPAAAHSGGPAHSTQGYDLRQARVPFRGPQSAAHRARHRGLQTDVLQCF